jgi:TRAP-type uncharacterized transport system substrate-binding protein
MSRSKEPRRFNLVTTLTETFGFSPLLATVVALFLLILAAGVVAWIWLSAPPRTLTITTGPAGSSFQRNAERYKALVEREGVTLNIVPSGGAQENLQRLLDPKSGVDIGFVQMGLANERTADNTASDTPPDGIVSLGSISYQPLWLFYRSPVRVTRLAELAGKRLGVGAPGSGVHTLAKALLEVNGVKGAPTEFVESPSETAAKDFTDGKLDAVFLMGDSAPTAMVGALIRTPDVQIFNFAQADAYLRRGFSRLNKIVVPQGSIDLTLNLPAQDITLLGPTVQLVAREGLNSAVSDLLLTVAQKVNGSATLFAKRGEFPAPLERGITVSDDALRFYKSGRSFTYTYIHNFWLANLTNRLLVVIVPLILVLIPTIRLLPFLYRWSVQLRIYRCYRPLLRLERDMAGSLTPERLAELHERLDEIEEDIHALKMPASFANQFYELRTHVGFVRSRLKAATKA